MCIRDSEGHNPFVDAFVPSTQKEEVLLSSQLLSSSGVENPVSYTHLRAHETVLDLVCRLLLEKKKTHATAK